MKKKGNNTSNPLPVTHLSHPEDFKPVPGSLDFCLNGYTFHDVHETAQIVQFETLFYKDFHEMLESDVDSPVYKMIVSKSREMDAFFNSQMLRVITYNQQDEPIGTICCYLDGLARLPGEYKENCDYSPLRKYFKVMELGRLAIRKDYRFNSQVSMGLILFVIRAALIHNIDLIIESAFPRKVKMFLHIGFNRFRNCNSKDQIYGISKEVCYYNFAAKLYSFINKKQPACKEASLSNYHTKVFRLLPVEEINKSYVNLVERNKNKPLTMRSYVIDYSAINILSDS